MISVIIDIHSKQRIELIPVTREVQQKILSEEKAFTGLLHLFVPHTTAAVTINEQADPDVAGDLEFFFGRISPSLSQYRHVEGNSAAHALSSLVGVSLMIPVTNGHLNLGTWQGLFFCEFDGPRHRTLQLTFHS